jgi:two-component system, NtrC family, sensor kinase
MKDEPRPEQADRVSDMQQLLHSSDDLDSLFGALEALDFDAGPASVAAEWARRVSRMLGNAPVGVCAVDPDTRESFVEGVFPDGPPASVRDPNRLFPSAAHEAIVPLEGLPGSTLHVAPGEGGADFGPLEERLFARAARLIAFSLRIAFRVATTKQPATESLRAQLVQTEKIASFGRVVANVIHELANPLTSIIAYSEYLARRARSRSDGGDDVERIDRIRESAQRILGLSRDLISYARPAKPGAETVLLSQAVDRALSFCEHELATRNIVVTTRHARDLPPVRGALAPIVQVFVNLITNAAHAMDGHGGDLTLETMLGDDGTVAVAQVTDTGSGMTPEVLARVFEPFFTTKEDGVGSGLGLVIVREILTAHGGRVRASSTPGTGTTFVLEFPLLEHPPSARRPVR